METYIVDVQMPFGWWTVCKTTSKAEAKEFEQKQKLNGCKTRFTKTIINS